MAEDPRSCSGAGGLGLDVFIWMTGNDRGKQERWNTKGEPTQLLACWRGNTFHPKSIENPLQLVKPISQNLMNYQNVGQMVFQESNLFYLMKNCDKHHSVYLSKMGQCCVCSAGAVLSIHKSLLESVSNGLLACSEREK